MPPLHKASNQCHHLDLLFQKETTIANTELPQELLSVRSIPNTEMQISKVANKIHKSIKVIVKKGRESSNCNKTR